MQSWSAGGFHNKEAKVKGWMGTSASRLALTSRLYPIEPSRQVGASWDVRVGFHGQSLIFEIVLLFAIAVNIFIVLFYILSTYQSYYNTVNISDQLSSIRSLVSANIVELAGKEGNSSVSLKIPKTIGDEFYKIELTNNGLNITTIGKSLSVYSNLFLNETYQMAGRVVSNAGEIVINKQGDKINII